MRPRLTAVLFAATAALAGPAQAALVAENLLTGLPDGFKVGFQTRQGPMDMMEFIPAAETVDDWSAMVTVQVFHDVAVGDVDAFASALGRLWQGGCEGGSVAKLDSGEVNGYPFAVWHYWCPLDGPTGKPEAMWLKAISGADALYAVQYAYRAEPNSELEERALAYLAETSVCDTRRNDRRCPPGM